MGLVDVSDVCGCDCPHEFCWSRVLIMSKFSMWVATSFVAHQLEGASLSIAVGVSRLLSL